MNRKSFLKSLSEGRGNCPLPSRTHPQKQNLVVYTEELTYLGSGNHPCYSSVQGLTGSTNIASILNLTCMLRRFVLRNSLATATACV
jgi:hypothetical protein